MADSLRKVDSLEILYAKDSQFKTVTDTLPLYTLDENRGWEKMQVVTYYYDSPDRLRKITFWNGFFGQEGVYHFYFEGVNLRKVRALKEGGILNFQYYFREEDNHLSPLEIEKKLRIPQMKELYELLNMSRTFTQKFKSLL
ncbi:MAG: hypothetical protein ACXWCZ_10520 [Flavisolibacter sp.]